MQLTLCRLTGLNIEFDFAMRLYSSRDPLAELGEDVVADFSVLRLVR